MHQNSLEMTKVDADYYTPLIECLQSLGTISHIIALIFIVMQRSKIAKGVSNVGTIRRTDA